MQTEDDFYGITAERARPFDDLCAHFGRDPAAIRHSVVCFPPLTPWESVGYCTHMVGRLQEAGIEELVLYWPQTWREQPREEAVFEEVTHAAIPAMRGDNPIPPAG